MRVDPPSRQLVYPSTALRFVINLVLAAVSGALFACSFPNVAIGWLMFVALLPLFVALSRAGGYREAFLLGWLSQSIAWLMMVPWVVRVMSHYGGLPYVTGVVIFVAMCAYLGLYGGVFALLFHRIAPSTRFRRWLLVPLAWAAVEYARTYLFSGFPWNLIAASIVDYASLVQFDRVAGPYALGVLILLPSTLIAWLVMRGVRERGIKTDSISHTQPPTPHSPIFPIAGVVIITFVWWATGLVAAKLVVRNTEAPINRAALLQPNISQEMRWDNDNLLLIFRRMMAMTEEATSHGAEVVIWPESTVPLSYATTGFYRQAIES
ncbi:MAG: apolipoprotein N-acyltransferase, partial [Thermoanaerobaculia bacterium]